MAMLQSEMAEWARAAELHAQLAIERIEVDDEVPAHGHDARVSGTVVRVFRGDQRLLSQTMTWVVDVLVPGEDPPPSGTLWSRLSDLRAVRVLEAYVSASDDGVHRVVLGMTSRLEAPTDTPQARHYEEAEDEAAGPEPAPRISANVKLVAAIALAAVLGWAYALWAWSR